MTQTALVFDGPTETPSNVARLTGQLRRVVALMQDGGWRTLSLISELTGDPPASVSAQLRHARKDRFGGSVVERRYLGSGLYSYRLTVSAKTRALLEVAQ